MLNLTKYSWRSVFPTSEIDCFNIYDQNECTWNPTGGFIGEGGCEANP